MRPRFVSCPILIVLLASSAGSFAQQRKGTRVDEFDTRIQNQMMDEDEANRAMADADRKAMTKDQGYQPKLKIAKKARVEMKRGDVALSHSDFASAREHFAAAVQAQPDLAIGHLDLGAAEMNLNQLEPAKQEFETAAKLAPGMDMAFQDIGALEIRRGNFGDAESALKTANRLAPTDLKTLTLLAYAQDLNHEYDSAVASAERVHLAKNHTGYSFAHLIAGSALQATGRSQEAIAEYEIFLKEDPMSPRAEEAKLALRKLKAKQMSR